MVSSEKSFARSFLPTWIRPSTLDTRPSSLLHQRHALRDIILDDGADLVFDL